MIENMDFVRNSLIMGIILKVNIRMENPKDRDIIKNKMRAIMVHGLMVIRMVMVFGNQEMTSMKVNGN